MFKLLKTIKTCLLLRLYSALCRQFCSSISILAYCRSKR